MSRKIIIISSFVPLLGLFSTPRNTALLLYSLFVWIYFYQQRRWQSSKGGMARAVITAALVVLFLTETLAWLDNYFKGFTDAGATFSTNYFENLVIGSGFYLGMTIAWVVLNKFFSFSTFQAFFTYGVFGIFLEQGGAVFGLAAGLAASAPPLAVLIVLFLFVIHGSILGLIHMRLAPHFAPARQSMWKYPLAILAIVIGVSAGVAISGGLAKAIFS